MYLALHEVTWCMVVWCTQNLHRDGSSFMWHQPCQRCKYTTSVDIQKASHSCRITCERSESAQERRIALYKSNHHHHHHIPPCSWCHWHQLVGTKWRHSLAMFLQLSDWFLTNWMRNCRTNCCVYTLYSIPVSAPLKDGFCGTFSEIKFVCVHVE